MRLDSCYHFNAEELIKNLKKWRKEKEKLQKQLSSLSELPSKNNESGIRSSEISKPTERQALTNLRIQDEIEDIELCEEAYEYGMSQMTPEERDLLSVFFNPKRAIWREVEDYSAREFMSRMTVYNRRKDALRKLNKIIEDKYF